MRVKAASRERCIASAQGGSSSRSVSPWLKAIATSRPNSARQARSASAFFARRNSTSRRLRPEIAHRRFILGNLADQVAAHGFLPMRIECQSNH